MLRRHEDEIVNYIRVPIDNGAVESPITGETARPLNPYFEENRMSTTYNSILLIRQAELHGKRPAIIDIEGSHSYEQLLLRSQNIAANLLDGRADLKEMRVAFLAPPGFEFVCVQWGIWLAGGIAVPLCVSHPLPEWEYTIADSQADIVVVHSDFSAKISCGIFGDHVRHVDTKEIFAVSRYDLPTVSPNRRALIVYTSGTTGKPKGVVMTHHTIGNQITTLINAWEWRHDDYIVNVLPLHHLHGLINVVACALWIGATCEMHSKFDAKSVWQSFLSGRPTLFMAVPTVYIRMIRFWENASADQRQKMSEAAKKLRLTVSGSAALPVMIFRRWKEVTGQVFLERYGMTEIGMAISNPYRSERRPGMIGIPLPGVQIRLIDETGKRIACDDVPGEIQVYSKSIFQEYWNRPEETEGSFQGKWFKTRDIAVIQNHYYKILGRSSIDIIKSGGYKISALEIEEVLRDHSAIKECAVVGIDDPEWGERIAVAIELHGKQSITPSELRAWGKERMAVYKVPREYMIVDELPRNAVGKVVKPEVKDLFDTSPP